ncbi:hypothetical protein BU16DRAFT_557676 [Lophium mytilinum]|uniref:Xylanolytic transcriptional activator regulatory domain-containing protein n=1 Tax=Lophium mytilinum TaxID=390894 RepID=A0A6A6R778_9PEZI|nr:hypothetical protein BU16DRAFT_557676 [Lophium mytilinum]
MPTLLTFNGPPSLGSFTYNDTAKFFESQLSLENGMRDHGRATFARLDSLHISARRQRTLQSIFASDYLSWMPLLDSETYSSYARYAEAHMFQNTDSMTCITLFSYAIAAVLEKKDILYDGGHDVKDEELWFNHATFILEQLQWSLDDTGIERIVCRILQAGYMLSSMRPLRAWSCISTASRDCMLLLKTAWRSRDEAFQNQVARVYWACYVLENELEICLELQPTGLRAFQADIPLPSGAACVSDLGQGSGLYYFLAIATLRRLLTDAVETVGFESGSAIYAPLVALELRSQLQSWYNHLPPSLKFPIDTSTVFDPHKAHLRTQYFGLIATISWPFLLRMLETSHHSATSPGFSRGHAVDPDVEAQAKECLMICILHLRTVEGTLLHKTIVSHTTLRSTCAVTMILLLVYPSPICGTVLDEIPAAISMVYEALTAWADIPFMVTPLGNFRNLAKAKGIELLETH